MTKPILKIEDLVGIIGIRTCVPQQEVEIFLKYLLDNISQTVLQDGIVEIEGLGHFRLEASPGTHAHIVFCPEKELLEQLNKPFSSFQPEKLSPQTHFEEVENIVCSLEEYQKEWIISEKLITSQAPIGDPKNRKRDLADIREQQEQANATADEASSDLEEPDFRERLRFALTDAKEEWEQLSELFQKARLEQAQHMSGGVCSQGQEEPSEKSQTEEALQEYPHTTEEQEKLTIETEEITEVESSESSQEESSDTEQYEENQEQEKRLNMKHRFLLISVYIIIFLGGIYILFPGLFDNIINYTRQGQGDGESIEAIIVENDEVQVNEPHPADTLRGQDDSSLPNAQVEQGNDSSINVEENKSEQSENKPVEKRTSVQHITVKYGDTYRTLALQYYGSKEFWGYIYQANKQKAPNPNILQIGAQIIIPDGKSLGINVKDQQSLSKARKLGEALLQEFEQSISN